MEGIVLLALALTLQGCMPLNRNAEVSARGTQSTTNVSEDDQSLSEEESSSRKEEETKIDVKRVGEANYGFIDVPFDWVKFEDVDVTIDIIQYCDLSGASVVTLNAWQDPNNSAKNAASAVWVSMEQEGAKDVTGATVKIGEYTAYQVYGFYPNQSKTLVTWFFETDDGYIHYVAAEALTDDIYEIVNRIEKSFSLEG